jgi:hypothetical protein
MGSIQMASLKMSRWNLLTHPGFVTYPHKDANGLCTWVYAHQGVKIWGVLKPTSKSDACSQEDMFRAHAAMTTPPGDISWDDNSKMYTIFLSAGDLLYVPRCFIAGKFFDTTAALCRLAHGILSTLRLLVMSPVDISIRWSRFT